MARSRRRYLRFLSYAALLAILALSAFTLHLDLRVRSEFEGRRFSLPARIYARPLELHAGLRLAQGALEQELRDLGYRYVPQADEPGSFTRSGEGVEIHARPFVFWDGPQPARRLRVAFDGRTVAGLSDAQGAALPLARLEPLPLGGISPAGNEDRVLVRLKQVPKHFIDALLAIEDRSYYSHHGFDPRGLARAALSLVSGDRLQGGSTLTQQLVKNYFLNADRTVIRKLNEAMMALLLERHYGKSEILEAYINEVFLGQQGSTAIHGFARGARFYFDQPHTFEAEERRGETVTVDAAYVERQLADMRRQIEELRGQGLDFAELREYSPGDDIRKIDWNVFARTLTPHIKEFHEEKLLTAWLYVDLSPSMFFGRTQTKAALAVELADQYLPATGAEFGRAGGFAGDCGAKRPHNSCGIFRGARFKGLQQFGRRRESIVGIVRQAALQQTAPRRGQPAEQAESQDVRGGIEAAAALPAAGLHRPVPPLPRAQHVGGEAGAANHLADGELRGRVCGVHRAPG